MPGLQSKTAFTTLTDAATVAFDFNVSECNQVTLGGNRTFTFSNPVAGGIYVVKITQDSSGSRLVTWPSTVKWAGGSAPTLTSTASRTDVIYFFYDGTSYLDIAVKLNHTLP